MNSLPRFKRQLEAPQRVNDWHRKKMRKAVNFVSISRREFHFSSNHFCWRFKATKFSRFHPELDLLLFWALRESVFSTSIAYRLSSPFDPISIVCCSIHVQAAPWSGHEAYKSVSSCVHSPILISAFDWFAEIFRFTSPGSFHTRL